MASHLTLIVYILYIYMCVCIKQIDYVTWNYELSNDCGQLLLALGEQRHDPRISITIGILSIFPLDADSYLADKTYFFDLSRYVYIHLVCSHYTCHFNCNYQRIQTIISPKIRDLSKISLHSNLANAMLWDKGLIFCCLSFTH